MSEAKCPYCVWTGSEVGLRWHLYEMFLVGPDFDSPLDLGRGDVVRPDNDCWLVER